MVDAAAAGVYAYVYVYVYVRVSLYVSVSVSGWSGGRKWGGQAVGRADVQQQQQLLPLPVASQQLVTRASG